MNRGGKRRGRSQPKDGWKKKRLSAGRGRGGRGASGSKGSRGPTAMTGTLDKNRRGFGFLSFDAPETPDLFVPDDECARFFHGDRVRVRFAASGRPIGFELVEHRFAEVVGVFLPDHLSSRGWVVWERKRAREQIEVLNPPAQVREGDWVRAKLDFGPPVRCRILDVFGASPPASRDVETVAAEFGLNEEHPRAALMEASRLRGSIERELESLGETREDLRRVPFITIDGETARDFDDAIHVEREKSGYALWVAIADVSHYVREGTELDRSARERGTSVYFPERAFHMLPGALSEHLCSLKPDEPRLALVSRIPFDREGKPGATSLHEAVIQSRRRATYNEIEREFRDHRARKDWEFRPHFELYELIKKRRLDRGALDLDLPEAEIRVDDSGEPVSIARRERLDSHRLIEEFMIAANEAVSRWMIARGRQFLFRVHEHPDESSFEKFATMAAGVGAHYRSESFGNREVAAFLRSIAGRPVEQLLNYALLRALKQARYNPQNLGHFGLASTAYTHFTSPIRRYPDLVVHRLIREALRENEEPADETRAHLAEIAEHCNYRERLAADAEREAIKIKQVRALAKHLGDTLDARISGMNAHGMYAQTAEPWAEGWISVERLPGGEDFRFDEDKMVYYARRSKKAYRVGDPLRVKVVRADIGRREVELEIDLVPLT